MLYKVLFLAILVRLFFLVGKGTPHGAKFLANAAKGQVRIFLLDLGTVFLGKEHESRKWFFSAVLFLGRALCNIKGKRMKMAL